MAKTDKTTALRKRTQIDKTNKLVFIWVAGASVLVSAAAVLIIMMVQKGIHNQKAISELSNTITVLRANNENVGELENQVRALGSEEALLKLRNSDSDNALRVILDALPAEPNSSALGASLQDKLFGRVQIESVQVDPVGDDSGMDYVEDEAAEDAATDEAEGESGADIIPFRFVVRGAPKDLKVLLERLQRSVRTIEVMNVLIESESGGKQRLTVEGQAYYLPAYELQLREKEIKR